YSSYIGDDLIRPSKSKNFVKNKSLSSFCFFLIANCCQSTSQFAGRALNNTHQLRYRFVECWQCCQYVDLVGCNQVTFKSGCFDLKLILTFSKFFENTSSCARMIIRESN